MPSYPPQVLATVALNYIGIGPPTNQWSCTFILKPLSPTGPYVGGFIQGTNDIHLTWHWGQGQPTGYADANWTVGPYTTFGTWETKPITPNPYLNYQSNNVTAGPSYPWSTTLVITA